MDGKPEPSAAVDVTEGGAVEELPHPDDERAPDDLSSDNESDDDDGTEDISIGVAVKRDDPSVLLRNQFVSKLGGKPAWLDPVQLPVDADELHCKASGDRLRFLLQLYAPINEDDRAFHRVLYLFISPKGARLAEHGAARAFRCQLPRQNAFYPFEPPEPDERPSPLSAEAARLASRRCPAYAEAADGRSRGGKAKASAVAPPGFPEYELVVEPEPDASEEAANNPQVARVLAAYEAKLKEKADADAKRELATLEQAAAGKAATLEQAAAGKAAAGKEGGDKEEGGSKDDGKDGDGGKDGGGKDGGGVVKGGPDDENDFSAFDGSRNPEVEDFSSFSLRVSREPEQAVRYTFADKSDPLWTSRQRQPKPSDIPPCQRCGAARRFEFQVMPQCINHLGVDSADDDAPDWATIAVYTCSKSCAPLPPLPSNGGLEDPTGPGDSAALAAVGMRMRIVGLNSRPDLNDTECEVLHWHVQSSRWAVECAAAEPGGEGEKMRIRSANLRPLPFAAGGEAPQFTADGLQREGGYAEEYVWVQTHQ